MTVIARARERIRAETKPCAETAAGAKQRRSRSADLATPAGFNVLERNRIHLCAMHWHTRAYPPLGIREDSARRAGPFRFLAWFLLELSIILAGILIVGILCGSDCPEWCATCCFSASLRESYVIALAGGRGATLAAIGRLGMYR